MRITRIILGIICLLAGWSFIYSGYIIQNHPGIHDIWQEYDRNIINDLETNNNSLENLTSLWRIMESIAMTPFSYLIEFGMDNLSDERFTGRCPRILPNQLVEGVQAIYMFSSKRSSNQKWFIKSDPEVDRYVKSEIDFYYEKYRKWMAKTPEEKKKPDFHVIRDFVFKRDTLTDNDPVVLLVMKKSFAQTDFRALAFVLDFDFFRKRLSEGLNIFASTFLEKHFGSALFDQIGGVEVTYNDEMIFRWGQLDTTITITRDAPVGDDEDKYSYTIDLVKDETLLFGYISDLKMKYGAYAPSRGTFTDAIMKHTISNKIDRGIVRLYLIAGILFTIAIVLLFNVRKRCKL